MIMDMTMKTINKSISKTIRKTAAATLLILCSALFSVGAIAGPGHDHGDAPAEATGAATPRFYAVSDLFELVGLVDGKRITVYLDRFSSNIPVTDAKVDLEIGGIKVALRAGPAGVLEGVLERAFGEGVFPVVASVSTGRDADLLAGELDLHGKAPDSEVHAHGWQEYAPIAAGTALLLVVLVLLVRRMRARSKQAVR